MKIPAPLQRWIEIDLDILAANCMEVRRQIGNSVKLMAVVKANGYGMGSIESARVFEEYADMLAVTTVEEGVELRNHGIKAPILVLAPAFEAEIPFYKDFDLLPSIDDEGTLRALNEIEGGPFKFHLVIDTGMNRVGISVDEAMRLLKIANEMDNVIVEGVYSHLASAAAKDKSAAHAQLNVFTEFLTYADNLDLKRGMAHIANSAAVLCLPQSRLDMVRVGTLLYGQAPCTLPPGWKIQNPWSVKAKVLAIHDVKAGETVGYGGDFKAKKPVKVGIVAMGYADGFTMEPHARTMTFGNAFKEFTHTVGRIVLNKPRYYALYKGKKLPIVGRVSMQLTIVDLKGTDIICGSVVELPMRRIASNALLCRVYKKNGKIFDIHSIIGFRIDNNLPVTEENEKAEN